MENLGDVVGDVPLEEGCDSFGVVAMALVKTGMDMVRWWGLLGGTAFPKNPPGGDFFRMYGGSLGVSRLLLIPGNGQVA